MKYLKNIFCNSGLEVSAFNLLRVTILVPVMYFFYHVYPPDIKDYRLIVLIIATILLAIVYFLIRDWLRENPSCNVHKKVLVFAALSIAVSSHMMESTTVKVGCPDEKRIQIGFDMWGLGLTEEAKKILNNPGYKDMNRTPIGLLEGKGVKGEYVAKYWTEKSVRWAKWLNCLAYLSSVIFILFTIYYAMLPILEDSKRWVEKKESKKLPEHD